MTRSQAMVLAHQRCSICLGFGIRQGRGTRKYICGCVWRKIFRSCHRRFREIVAHGLTGSQDSVERISHAFRIRKSVEGGNVRRSMAKHFSQRTRIREEYLADLWLVAKRALEHHPQRWQMFRLHYLLGAPWTLIAPRLGMDKGTFFHEAYRIEELLGRAFYETKPYSLFPLDEYFGGNRVR